MDSKKKKGHLLKTVGKTWRRPACLFGARPISADWRYVRIFSRNSVRGYHPGSPVLAWRTLRSLRVLSFLKLIVPADPWCSCRAKLVRFKCFFSYKPGYLQKLFDCPWKVVRTLECKATKLRNKVAGNKTELEMELFDSKAVGTPWKEELVRCSEKKHFWRIIKKTSSIRISLKLFWGIAALCLHGE